MKATLSLIPVLAVAALALTPSNAAARGENELVCVTHNIEDTAAELRKKFQVH